MVQCSMCGINDSSLSTNVPRFDMICDQCKPIKKFFIEMINYNQFEVNHLLNNVIEEGVFDDRYMVSATYEVTYNRHNGYCSDPGDSDYEEDERKHVIHTTRIDQTYLLPLIAKTPELNEFNDIVVYSDVYKYYNYIGNVGCRDGSGVCGEEYETLYRLKRATVVKKDNIVFD